MEKENEDLIFINILISLVAIITLFVVTWVDIDNNQKDMKARLDRIEQQIKHRSKLDSLYWDHLEECAFELKEGVNYTEKN